VDVVEREAIRLTSLLIAGEDWAKQYYKAPEQHAELIQQEAKLQVLLVKYYREMSKKAGDFINWDHYNYQAAQAKQAKLSRTKLDFNVDVIINDSQIDDLDQDFIQLTLRTASQIVAIGAQAGEIIYNVPLNIQSTDAIIQALGKKQVAALVGKKVLKDGSIIDNPHPLYNTNDTVRADIAESIKTSLALGETTEQATARIADIINNPARAERIARTESVNAYNAGMIEFGNQSEAVGEEWMDAGATDECADYASRGPQPFGTGWDGEDAPPAHPNCRCAIRLIYGEE
jgi:uncharacterized protein YdaL